MNNMDKEKTDIRYVRPYRIEWEGKIHTGVLIGWDSNIGIGEFNIGIDEDNDIIEVDTETRCNNEDKAELELILDKAKEYILEHCKVTG